MRRSAPLNMQGKLFDDDRAVTAVFKMIVISVTGPLNTPGCIRKAGDQRVTADL